MMLANPENEKDWQAMRDLETMVEAEKIKRDKKRLAAAMKKKRELKKTFEQLDEKKS